MYAIKPCSTVGLIGSTIESYALGIGMRWRESNCIVFDKKKSPISEYSCYDRCVLTKRSIKLLRDLGCSEKKLLSISTPARSWRAISAKGEEIRSSSHFPGCPLGEVSYHCTKGSLLRVLRSEFLRYGGSVEWNSYVSQVISSCEAKVRIETTYGTTVELEGVICTTSSLASCVEHPTQPKSKLRINRGVVKKSSKLSNRLFCGDSEVCLIVGNRIAAHCWLMPNGDVSYKIIRSENEQDSECVIEVFADLIACSSETESWVLQIRQTSNLCESSGLVCFLGDGLLPVDAFEFRGDNAHTMIQESSALCKEIYGLKYHRGFLSQIFPRFHRMALGRRKELLHRDFDDLHSFSCSLPEVTDSWMRTTRDRIE